MTKKQEGASKKAKSAPRAKAKPAKVATARASDGAATEANKRTASAAASKQRGLSPELIGETAGELWRILNDRGGQSLAGLKKSVDASGELAMLAVGWLAREDKLEFETNGRTINVSLRDA